MVSLNAQTIIRSVESSFLKQGLPSLRIGDNVKIGVKIIEGTKERVQFYEGIILAKKNSSINTTIASTTAVTTSEIVTELAVEQFIEPMCRPADDRFALFPIRNHRMWEMYKKHVASFWTVRKN